MSTSINTNSNLVQESRLGTDSPSRGSGSYSGWRTPEVLGSVSDLYERTYQRQISRETAKLAARKNAAAVSPQEHAKLHQERQALLDKKFAGTISRKEVNRLAYVRWSLDRIEDAKHGAALDTLEDQVELYERFLLELKSFESSLRDVAKKK
jgi:hypothetical protein